VTAEPARNQILRKFAQSNAESYARFAPAMEPVQLERGAVLGPAHVRTEFVYFVETGVVSLVASTQGGNSLEVAIVGREGVAGIADALGVHPLPYRWIVHVAGMAYRVPTSIIRDHIMSCSELHELLMDYSQQVMHQLAQSAVCNRFHTSVERLARWLLLTSDRAGTTRLELTHEYIAQMVGAPRSAVTEAAAALRAKRIIDYRRGVLTIRNVQRLTKVACECVNATARAEGNGWHAPAPVTPAR
jgi:CRP-like cAMP-binding protein